MLPVIFVRIDKHAITFSGISVRIVDLGFEALVLFCPDWYHVAVRKDHDEQRWLIIQIRWYLPDISEPLMGTNGTQRRESVSRFLPVVPLGSKFAVVNYYLV